LSSILKLFPLALLQTSNFVEEPGALFDVYQFHCDICGGLVIRRESWIKWQGEVLPTVAVDR
jgi:hypothetical protein